MGPDDERPPLTPSGAYLQVEIIETEPADSSKKTPRVIGSQSGDLILNIDSTEGAEPPKKDEPPLFIPTHDEALPTDPPEPGEPQNGILLTRGDLALIFAGLPVICVLCVLLASALILHSIYKQNRVALPATTSQLECQDVSPAIAALQKDLSQKIAALQAQHVLDTEEFQEAAKQCRRTTKQLRKNRPAEYKTGTQDSGESPRAAP